MISRLLLLVLCCTIFLSAPLTAAGTDSSAGSSPTLLASAADDLFDADFGDTNDNGSGLIADPLERLNRGTFWVNDKFYFYLIKPVAKGYRFVTPRSARVLVDNFFSNLATPVRAVNSLLQLKFFDCGTELYRFIINTTVGLGGLFDPAQALVGFQRKNEDFGQTLGYYGAGHAFYLVLPIIGPSSLRDTGGMFVDGFFYPLRRIGLEAHEYLSIRGFEMTNRLSLDRDTYEGIIRDAIDPYLFVRAAYAQRRMAQISKQPYNVNTDIINNNMLDGELLNPFNWFGD
jgi:phospholipid-binding lipoprotein MlaA